MTVEVPKNLQPDSPGLAPDGRGISVVIPTYGRAAALPIALRSVLEQTLPPTEIIVVDDGSPEPVSRSALPPDPRVRVVRTAENLGPGAARNVGAREASGEMIAFLDDDDTWHPRKLELQAPSVAPGSAATSDYLMDDQVVRVPPEATTHPAHSYRLNTSSLVVHRDDWHRAGPFVERRDCAEDWVLTARLVSCGVRITNVTQPLAAYNWTAESLTASHKVRIDHIVGAVETLRRDPGLTPSQQRRVAGIGLGRASVVAANAGQLRDACKFIDQAFEVAPMTAVRSGGIAVMSYFRGVLRRAAGRKDALPANAQWQPPRDRLHPRPWQADYVQLRALSVQMENRIETRWPAGSGISVVDIGCGDKPYAPLFQGRTDEYVGVDVVDGPEVDVVASGDDLPFDPGSFNCALANGVLQLVPDPEALLDEVHRVLTDRGVLMLSTHGIGFGDRSSIDRWRWTHHGLSELFSRDGKWADVEVLPAGGVMCAAAYLAGGQLEFGTYHAGVPALAAPICLGLNAAAWQADRFVRRRFPDLPPDASVNYLVVATARK